VKKCPHDGPRTEAFPPAPAPYIAAYRSIRSFGDAQFRAAPDNLGDAEIRYLHAAFFVQQDVLGFDIAMDDPFIVSELQCSQICGTIWSASRGESFPARSSSRRFSPSTNSIMKKGKPLAWPNSWTATMFAVAQFRQRPRLAIEPFGKAGSGDGLRRKDLERDETVEPRLAGLVNRAHTAFAE